VPLPAGSEGLTGAAARGSLHGSMHLPAIEGFTLAQPEGADGIAGAALWVVGFLPASLAGLGWITSRLPGVGRPKPAVVPALGLSLLLAVGGVLNLAHIARPIPIAAVLAIGFLAFVHAARNWIRARTTSSAPDIGAWLLAALVAAVMAFTVRAVLKPEAYNWNDDIQSYFAHPVRMIETGTVFGSPLSSIGSVSLGGIAFVQGCVLLVLPLRAMNGADAVLGLFLCLLPLFALGASKPGMRLPAALAIAAAVVIDPFYVNVSALYLGSALIAAAVLLSTEEAEQGGSPVALALVYAALIALKPTFLLFAVLHLLAMVPSRDKGPRWSVFAAAWTAVFLSPWILVHLPHYLAPAAWPAAPRTGPADLPIQLLGAAPLINGFTGLLAYTVLVAALAAITVACLFLGKKTRTRDAAVAAAAVGVCAYPLMLFVFPRVVGYGNADPNAVRYFIPIVLGIFPVTLFLASESVRDGSPAAGRGTRLGLCVVLGLAALIPFRRGFAARVRQADNYRTVLPYSGALDPVLVKSMHYALGEAKEAEVRALQGRVPPGASIVAWIYTPYFLDYSRNPVFDAEVAGISNRWGRIPDADYMLWEYRGAPDLDARIKRIISILPTMDGFRTAPLREFDRRASEALRTGSVVFRNEEYVLVRTAAAQD
jgi:hypothetical protein